MTFNDLSPDAEMAILDLPIPLEPVIIDLKRPLEEQLPAGEYLEAAKRMLNQ